MRLRFPLATACAFLALLAGDAVARSSSKSVRFELRAHVPVICRLRHDPLVGPDGSLTVEEFCNDPRGYRVYALHSPGAAASGLVFEYDGTAVPADPDGETLLLDAPTAAKTVRRLRIRHTGNVVPVALPALSLRIEPK